VFLHVGVAVSAKWSNGFVFLFALKLILLLIKEMRGFGFVFGRRRRNKVSEKSMTLGDSGSTLQ